MGDVRGWFLLIGQIAVPIVALAAGFLFVAKVLRGRPAGAAPAGGSALPAPVVDLRERRTVRRAAVAIAASGFCLPWVVGLAVKAWLDAHGEPTYPVASFLTPPAVAVLVLATVAQWCWPFLLLAAWVGSRHFPRFAPRRTCADRLMLVRLTHGAGLVAGVIVFVPVFREWDTMYVFVPLGVFLTVPMGLGYGVGRLLLHRRDARTPPSN